MMKALVLAQHLDVALNPEPLKLVDRQIPEPGPRQILIRVSACGVCHTELDEIEARTPPPRLPVIPGHQVIGRVEACGPGAERFLPGERVGVAWIFSACGRCVFCAGGQENLCADFLATGRDVDGGYAQYMTAHEDFAHRIPASFSDVEAAPLLCAGAIGYRSLALTCLRDGQTLGLTGFGGSAHLVLKLAKYGFPASRIIVFARNQAQREFALELGATWAGDIDADPPFQADAIIDTTPAWKPVLMAMQNLLPGGRLVINAIRKEKRDKGYLATHLDYPRHLWMEKEIKSVANVCRSDVAAYLRLAAEMRIRPTVETYRLEDANRALYELRTKPVRGAKVLSLE